MYISIYAGIYYIKKRMTWLRIWVKSSGILHYKKLFYWSWVTNTTRIRYWTWIRYNFWFNRRRNRAWIYSSCSWLIFYTSCIRIWYDNWSYHRNNWGGWENHIKLIPIETDICTIRLFHTDDTCVNLIDDCTTWYQLSSDDLRCPYLIKVSMNCSDLERDEVMDYIGRCTKES